MVLLNALFCERHIPVLRLLNAPLFSDVSCGAPPEILNAHITSTQQQRYLPGAKVHYECVSNSQIMGVNYVICSDGHWTKVPSCRGRNLCFHYGCSLHLDYLNTRKKMFGLP